MMIDHDEGDDLDVDPGEPIALLSDLGVDPSSGFTVRIRRAVERRLFTTQLVDLAWSAPLIILLEYLALPFELFGTRRGAKGNRRS